jgi:NTE family protein
LSVVLGGGGAFGIAFHLGIAAGLDDAGIDISGAPMIGLSAGSYAAAALATATPLPQIAEAWRYVDSRTARGELVSGIRISERVFGDARATNVTAVSLRLPVPRRVVLDGGRYRLADLVAASSSPWGLAHGHVVDGRPLYDAGTVSNTAADLAPPADVLLVVAPLARSVLGWQGQIWEERLRRETAVWRLRHRGRVVVARPGAEAIRAGGGSWRRVMDMDVAPATFRAARLQGRALAPGLASVLRGREALALAG